MRTAAPVGITQCHAVGQHAAAGIVGTHAAMDKDLQRHVHIPGDLLDLGHRSFSSQHDAVGTEFLECSDSRRIQRRKLGRDVTLDVRGFLPGDRDQGQGRDDDRINADLFEIAQIFADAVIVGLMKDNIDRHIDFGAVFLGKL